MFSSPGASEDKSVGGVDGGEDIRGEGGLDIPVGGQWSGAPVRWARFARKASQSPVCGFPKSISSPAAPLGHCAVISTSVRRMGN